MNIDFSNLVLLIGTNPLPNYVVADYFLQINENLKSIWLVYAEKKSYQGSTKPQAENLEKLLNRKYKENGIKKVNIFFVPISDVGNAHNISNDINNYLIKLLELNSNTHLNYTGGTKVMGIHAYNALSESDKLNSKEFSYLDARRFKIICDNGHISKDLREYVNIGFLDLIDLHGFKRKNSEPDITYEQEVINFDNAIAKNSLDEFVRNKPKDGKWLEYYLYKKLQDQGLTPHWNLEIKKPEWRSDLYFEIDVIVMRGYQLIGISCTIMQDNIKFKKDDCKLKGFEIMHRVSQIGGEEAKAILVNFNEQPDILEQDLHVETGGAERIKVIGLPDFKANKAIENIIEFIQND